jgi:hypothetical protein
VATVNFQLGGVLKFENEEGHALITIRYRDLTLTARGDDMAYTIPVSHSVELQISYVDAHGNPAVVDGEVTWLSSDENVAGVVADASDSTRATLESGTGAGQAQITATADADLGSGSREIVTLMDVSVIPGEAVAGTISPVGEATPI